MRKLKLDALEVESFESVPERPAGLGTVHGQGDPPPSPPLSRLYDCGTDMDCPMWPLTWDPYNPCNTDEGSCAVC